MVIAPNAFLLHSLSSALPTGTTVATTGPKTKANDGASGSLIKDNPFIASQTSHPKAINLKDSIKFQRDPLTQELAAVCFAHDNRAYNLSIDTEAIEAHAKFLDGNTVQTPRSLEAECSNLAQFLSDLGTKPSDDEVKQGLDSLTEAAKQCSDIDPGEIKSFISKLSQQFLGYDHTDPSSTIDAKQ